jgi:hypothetical protein
VSACQQLYRALSHSSAIFTSHRQSVKHTGCKRFLGYPHSSYSKSILSEKYSVLIIYILFSIFRTSAPVVFYISYYISTISMWGLHVILYFFLPFFSLSTRMQAADSSAGPARYATVILYCAKNSRLHWDSTRIADCAAAPISLSASCRRRVADALRTALAAA